MKVTSAQFCFGAAKKSNLPQDLPEIAVVGRSNVGKSSLLNYLMGRKKLVMASKSPGKTREINYFKVNGKFYFVDIPGFGYAKLSQSDHMEMLKRIEMYFSHSKKIAGILFLIDSRISDSLIDRESLDWVQQWVKPLIFVATKADKFSPSQGQKAVEKIRKNYSLGTPPVLLSSTKKKGGDKLWVQIEELLNRFGENQV